MVENRVTTEIQALSPTEQKVYSELYSKRIITTKDVKRILINPHKTVDYITNLRQKGYFQKIRRGIYAIVPPNFIGKNDFNPDKFLIASKIKKEYYISQHSALGLHGLAESVYNYVWITTKKPVRSFSYQYVHYNTITTKYYFGWKKINYLGSKICVSDREKTILDSIRNPKYTGGFEELMKSLENISYLDWDVFNEYLERFAEKALYQKTGFIMANLKIDIPPQMYEKLKMNMGKRTYYLDNEKSSYYEREWNLMVPKRFKEWIRGA